MRNWPIWTTNSRSPAIGPARPPERRPPCRTRMSAPSWAWSASDLPNHLEGAVRDHRTDSNDRGHPPRPHHPRTTRRPLREQSRTGPAVALPDYASRPIRPARTTGRAVSVASTATKLPALDPSEERRPGSNPEHQHRPTRILRVTDSHPRRGGAANLHTLIGLCAVAALVPISKSGIRFGHCAHHLSRTPPGPPRGAHQFDHPNGRVAVLRRARAREYASAPPPRAR